MFRRLLVAAAVLSSTLIGPSAVSAQVPAYENSACPTLTDSVVRLYSAYFLREPEDDGYLFWEDGYRSGTWSLDRMSEFFARSPEFVTRYGGLDDLAFVRLVYANVLERAPDATGEQFWVSQLSSGAVTRGQLMLYFSESEEYVDKTGTTVPAQGYADWYVDGTRWNCGGATGGHQFGAGVKYVDVIVYNSGTVPVPVTISVFENGQWSTKYSQDLTPGGVAYGFNVAYGAGATAMSVSQAPDITGVIVESPVPTRMPRPGWASRDQPGA